MHSGVKNLTTNQKSIEIVISAWHYNWAADSKESLTLKASSTEILFD